MLQKSISNKFCSFVLSIHQRILIIRNATNHHIRLISEGSFNTEAWSIDAENSALTSQE